MTGGPGDARLQRLLEELGHQAADVHVARAPGRVNLIGDHTDYNDGFVLPAAIDLDCRLVFRRRDDGIVRIRSLDADPALPVELAADGSLDPGAATPPWGRYVAGVVRELADAGRRPVGLEGVLDSTVPAGGGLSSSASLESACSIALCHVAECDLTPEQQAAACQRAEQLATGVPCGIMDQLASFAGRAGHALAIDCRTLELQPVPIHAELSMLVVHCGVSRQLEGSEYAERRAACEAAARDLGVLALRDATFDQVEDNPLARHVVSENARVLEMRDALQAGDHGRAGELMLASHRSLALDYRVSTPELDQLVESLMAAGAIGARLTGAGFGGCVVALVVASKAEHVRSDACASYQEATGEQPRSWIVRASDGAAVVPAAG